MSKKIITVAIVVMFIAIIGLISCYALKLNYELVMYKTVCKLVIKMTKKSLEARIKSNFTTFLFIFFTNLIIEGNL